MELGAIGVASFGFLFTTLKKRREPQVRVSVETRLWKDRDEFLETKNRELMAVQHSKFLEENVRNIQTEFERRLEKTIFWREAYIYRHFMCKWFSGLCEKYRYDRLMLERVRSDWLSYLSLLEQIRLSQLLSVQSNNEEIRQSSRLRASEARKAHMAIEEAFARQIGNKEVEKLQRVRKSEDDAFDRSGKKEMAPDGYHYFCVSFEPYNEVLRPRKVAASPKEK